MKVRHQPVVNCAIYACPCPADRGSDRTSDQEQRDACTAFVSSQREHGWRALRTRYIDSDSSRPTMQRSSLRRLIEHIRMSIVHVVVVYRLEHLSVNLVELAEVVEVIQQHNAALVSLSQQLNTREPAGRLAVKLLLSFASFENKSASEIQAKAGRVIPPGLSLSSKPPEYEKFLERAKETNSRSRHTIRIQFVVLGAERQSAFLRWARKGFRFRKRTASQPSQ